MYALYRSTRAVAATNRLVKRGEWDRYAQSSQDIFKIHAQTGIAPDGSPTGFEHVVVFDTRAGAVIVRLRAYWTEYDAAAQVRERLLGGDVALDANLTFRVYQAAGCDRSHLDSVRSRGFIVDVDPAYAEIAKSRDRFLEERWPRIALLEQPMLETIYDALWRKRRLRDKALPIKDPRERALVDTIVANPRDDDAVDVYADFLEERGRDAEVQVLRELVVGADDD